MSPEIESCGMPVPISVLLPEDIAGKVTKHLVRNRRLRSAFTAGDLEGTFDNVEDATQEIVNEIIENITLDPEIIKQIFNESGLMNEKLDDPEYLGLIIDRANEYVENKNAQVDWMGKLRACSIPKTASSLERKKAYEVFISGELKEMCQSDWEIFVKNEVRESFGLKLADVKLSIREASIKRKRNSTEKKEVAISFGDKEDVAANAIAVLAKEFIEKYPPLFFLGGDMYVYDNGIYTTNETAKTKAKEFIYELAEMHGIDISPDNNERVIRRVMDLNTASPDELCKSPERIAVENGILDTRDRVIYDITPDEKHISRLPVRFDESVTVSEDFIHYLNVMFKGYEWQIPIVQEMFGFCLYKKYFIEKFFFLVGNGGNGRSTLINILTRMLGEENTSALSVHDVCKPNDRHMLLSLNGKFANLCGETGSKEIENLGKLKAATGGDLIVTRDLYKSWVKFENYAKFIFSMNEAPAIYDGTRGRKRRMEIIKFPVDFEAGGSAEDKELLLAKLCSPEALSGVLNWSLEGLSRLLLNKVMSNARTENETADEYDKLSHPIRHFINAHIDTVQTHENEEENLQAFNESRVTERDLLEVYGLYAKKYGLPSQNISKLVGVVKAECAKLGIETTQGRDRYAVDAFTREPLPRNTFLRGIVIKGRDYLTR